MDLAGLIGSLSQSQEVSLEFKVILILFGHSILLGIILTVQTIFFAQSFKDKKSLIDNILSASNLLFLCVGLTGVMLLINNNLARALAIGATLSLTRFRVKLGQKSLASNILFGIIVGVACGLNQLKVAWLVTGIYILLQLLLVIVSKIVRKIQNKVPKTPEEITE